MSNILNLLSEEGFKEGIDLLSDVILRESNPYRIWSYSGGNIVMGDARELYLQEIKKSFGPNLSSITIKGSGLPRIKQSTKGLFENITSLTSLNISDFYTDNVVDMSEMFYGCRSLETLDLYHFDTNNVTDMSRMFTNCYSLTSLDLRNFDTHKVTDMSEMFAGCNTLRYLDLSSFDMSNVSDTRDMFVGCQSLTYIWVKPENKARIEAILSQSGVTCTILNSDIFAIAQQRVREGTAQNYYSLGDIFCTIMVGEKPINFRIVAFDVAEPADPQYTHSMTLCATTAVAELPFSLPENIAGRESPYPNIKQYGSSDYSKSAIRQWLNSPYPKGKCLTALTRYSSISGGLYNQNNGFMYRLNPHFLSVIGKTKIMGTLSDEYFYLPSATELGYDSSKISYINEDGQVYPYFNGGYTVYSKYWTRTPYQNSNYMVNYMNSGGALESSTTTSHNAYTDRRAATSNGVVPFCNII